MPLIKRSSPEEKDAQRAAKEAERAARDAAKAREREAQEREKLRTQFFRSPAGLARQAYEREDQIFQASFDVLTTQAVTVALVGAFSRPKSTTDPTDILNSICHEGWELVNGSVVFLETGSESRDKFMRSGQQIAVSGTIYGYYLFKRSEANKRDVSDPWQVSDEVLSDVVAEIASDGSAGAPSDVASEAEAVE